MSTCLGIYIEKNLIKYAKLSKENNVIKVDAFNMKFYDKLDKAIEQIISETYNYRAQISTNLPDEQYNFFKIFSLLNKKDINNVVNTEFESICYDKQQNKDAYETRYLLVNDLEDKEKIKAIHVSCGKASLTKRMANFEQNKLQSITPIGISISNLLSLNEENIVILNIEEKTTVTTIIDKNIYDVDVLENGASQILDKINDKENSYSKAYEICKNTTLYTSSNEDLIVGENDYLDEIVPTLYEIAGNVRKIINNSPKSIDKVYITGTAAVINNIDIYFQEYLKDVKCEILKPYFLDNIATNINIKDYIEVNSAIAIALEGLGEGIKEVNFKKHSGLEKALKALNTNIGSKKSVSSGEKPLISMDFSEKLSGKEKAILRTMGGVIFTLAAYIGCTLFIGNQMNAKLNEIQETKAVQQSYISKVVSDRNKIDNKANEYSKLSANLQSISETVAANSRTKNAIPTLLNNIMYVIPKNVRLTSIENTQGTHIVINAEAEQYEQLGYFKAILKTENILSNVVSDSAKKEGGIVKVTIEGDIV